MLRWGWCHFGAAARRYALRPREEKYMGTDEAFFFLGGLVTLGGENNEDGGEMRERGGEQIR